MKGLEGPGYMYIYIYIYIHHCIFQGWMAHFVSHTKMRLWDHRSAGWPFSQREGEGRGWNRKGTG